MWDLSRLQTISISRKPWDESVYAEDRLLEEYETTRDRAWLKISWKRKRREQIYDRGGTCW